MAKYHPMINKDKGKNMGIWEKIKCFFGGNCVGNASKEQMAEAMNTYRAEPKVIVVDVKQTPVEVILTKEVKKRHKAEVKKVTEAHIKEKSKSTPKVKRSWYNNNKTQKLVAEIEVAKLPKTWKKGKLKK